MEDSKGWSKADSTHIHEPSFYTKKGWLTIYALSCGYREIYRSPGEKRIITLYLEHGVYNVRGYDYEKHERLFWDQFDSVFKARTFWERMVKKYA